MKLATRLRRTLLPPTEWILNYLVCKIPLVAPRMGAYARLGVDLADHRTGIIMLGTHITAPKNLRIGRNTSLGRNCVLDARGGIEIGEDVNISSYSRMQGGKHRINDPDFASQKGSIRIGDRAWIAEGAMLLGNITIGEGAVVAGGAVVTKDVDPYTIVGGVPARPIGERSRELTYRLDFRPNWV